MVNFKSFLASSVSCLKISRLSDASVTEHDNNAETDEQSYASLVGETPGPPDLVFRVEEVTPDADAGHF